MRLRNVRREASRYVIEAAEEKASLDTRFGPLSAPMKKPPDGGDGRPGADEQSGRTRLSSQTLSDYGVTIR